MLFDQELLQSIGSKPIAETAGTVISIVQRLVPRSSTRESLSPIGYSVSGSIEVAIREYQASEHCQYRQALKAIECGCGNCQELAYVGAIVLRALSFKGDVKVGHFGLNHAFLIVDDYILDPWVGDSFPFDQWPEKLKAYGGSVKAGIMKGRVLAASHFELEDEEPETVTVVPIKLKDSLPLEVDRVYLSSALGSLVEQSNANDGDDLHNSFPRIL